MRKSKIIKVMDGNEQREYVITEMPVWQIHELVVMIGARLLKSGAIQKAVAERKGVANATLETLTMGILDNLSQHISEADLLDISRRLLTQCVEYKVGATTTPLDEESVNVYVDSYKTFALLGKTALDMHLGFLADAIKSEFLRASPTEASNGTTSKPKMYLNS